ncbi:MAG: antitoxin [Patescibacteria group bacterium]
MKNKTHFDPFANLVLDKEEQLIEEALEKGEYESDPNFEDTKKMLEEAAQRYQELNTSKPITVRIKQLDLIRLKAKAKAKNIPYQTLLGVLITEYVEGKTNLRL